jgi:hypothetical protein
MQQSPMLTDCGVYFCLQLIEVERKCPLAPASGLQLDDGVE